MQLINLKVFINQKLIRDIPFKQGLNLITNKRGVGRSGNSVGKSTLSRVIDYLFLASIESIYVDEEFKKANEEIEHLLKTSHVFSTLEFIGIDKNTHSISRNLCIEKSDRTFFFDAKEVDEDEYERNIQEYFFDIKTIRPSVRFIAHKFIRNDSHRMLNTTKFLNKSASAKDYGELFLYLFGFKNTALLTEKREASNAMSKRKKNSAAVNSLVKEQKPSSEIKIYARQASELERDLLKFDYSPEFSDPIGMLSSLQAQEDVITERALATERKIENITRTIELLTQQGGNYLVNELRAIYTFAGVSINGALQEFENVLSFHDNLVAKKKQFLSIDLPELRDAYQTYENELLDIQKARSKIFSNMRSTESISSITSKLKSLGDLKVTLGKLEGLVDQQQKAAEDLRKADESLSVILSSIANEIDYVSKFESVLNKKFGEVTDIIHAEKYEFSLNFDSETGNCTPEVIATSSNPEGGKKKAEVIAFDFSYIQTVDELKAKRPVFVFHDGIEDIDQKQIDDIFNLARRLPGQQIVSMLSDKLTEDMYKDYLKDSILLLSEDDKFFST